GLGYFDVFCEVTITGNIKTRHNKLDIRIGIRDLHSLTSWLKILRTPETRRHPAFVCVKEITVGRSYVHLWRCEGTAAQDLLIHKPLVVVLIKLRFKTRIRNVIRGGPLPNIADHLVTTMNRYAVSICANRYHRTVSGFK